MQSCAFSCLHGFIFLYVHNSPERENMGSVNSLSQKDLIQLNGQEVVLFEFKSTKVYCIHGDRNNCLCDNYTWLCFVPGLDDLKSCVLVLVSVLLLSPVLKTLTDSISTDTIYAMTVSNTSQNKYLSNTVFLSPFLTLKSLHKTKWKNNPLLAKLVTSHDSL